MGQHQGQSLGLRRLPSFKHLARDGARPRGGRMGPSSVLRHCRRCLSECEIRRNGSSLNPPLATTVDAVGVIAGGGVEFAILPNWSVKAEYLYVSFNNQTIGPGTFTPIENVVRGGVNYRF